jgi:hypothetical protein
MTNQMQPMGQMVRAARMWRAEARDQKEYVTGLLDLSWQR